MNRNQAIALAMLALNLVLVLLFPPHDYVTLQRGNLPTFDGFYWIFSEPHNRVINRGFLQLEVLVIAINACIAWLLLRPTSQRSKLRVGNRAQRVVLLLVGVNLVLALLFPPFENYHALTKALLPTFEGFYFILGENSTRLIVTPILYIEVALILINGGLAWLFFRDGGTE